MTHPFDSYAVFTDLAKLNEASARPLRKCIRVNTLKTTVAAFREHASAKGWSLTPVPWCEEGFFIDREDRSEALGKDPWHLLGHFYMQEASSMLPVALLEPQPGEIILDMSAAPGSKTTQIASALKGTGMILANDVQEKRLWTLKTACHRLGAHNVLYTKKVGQWFAKHCTERFDRVLCDAPCTAQGTVRKDSDALRYCSLENIEKMAVLQVQLLEAAVHAAKIGGRIVYSTCTLTPEENEGVVLRVLEKFGDVLEVVDWGMGKGERGMGILSQAKEDSVLLQQSVFPIPHSPFPSYRVWPQTYDTEGFFCAVLCKTGATMGIRPMKPMRLQERPLLDREQAQIARQLEEIYGTSYLHEGDRLFERAGTLLLATDAVASFDLPVENYSLGIPFAKKLDDGRVRLTNEVVTLRGMEATHSVHDLSDEDCAAVFRGADIPCDPTLHGDVVLRHGGIAIGIGLAVQGTLKNRLSRWLVGHRQG